METYISVDIETDGPIPGDNSMLSIGAVAYQKGVEVGQFYYKLEPLSGAHQDPNTMEWWAKFPETWTELQESQRDPIEGTHAFIDWVNTFERPVLCAWPVAFDVMFIRWYAQHLCGINLHPLTSLDMRSYAAGVLGCPLKDIHRHIPKVWKLTGHGSSTEMEHNALSDAREQGAMLMHAMAWRFDAQA